SDPKAPVGAPQNAPAHIDPNGVLDDAIDAARPALTEPGSSVDRRIDKGGGAVLAQLDREISRLMNKRDLSEADFKALQQLMQKRNEMYTLFSNMQRMFHEMCMTAINNTR